MFNNLVIYLKITALYLSEAIFPYFFMCFVYILGLIFLGLGLLIQDNFSKVIEEKKSKYEIITYLKENADRKSFEKAVNEFPNIYNFTYVNPEKVKERIYKENKELGEVVNSLDFNPIPVTYSIILKKEVWSKDKVKDLVDFLAKRIEVEETDFGEEWIDSLDTSFKNIEFITVFIQRVSLIFGFLLMLSSTINCHKYLNAHKNRLKLLGAGKSFIHIPFIMAGVFVGVFSTVIAIIFLKLGFSYLSADLPLYYLSMQETLIIFGMGFFIPIIGNLFNIN